MTTSETVLEIPVIQFLRPHGKQRKLTLEVDNQFRPTYERAVKNGYDHIEAELLHTREIAITMSSKGMEDIGPEFIPPSENRPGNTSTKEACLRLLEQAANGEGRKEL